MDSVVNLNLSMSQTGLKVGQIVNFVRVVVSKWSARPGSLKRVEGNLILTRKEQFLFKFLKKLHVTEYVPFLAIWPNLNVCWAPGQNLNVGSVA